MAQCEQCSNFDDEHIDGQIDMFKNDPDYQPDLYYYWQYPLEEDYLMPNNFECMCEICFDIANSEKKIKWNCTSL